MKIIVRPFQLLYCLYALIIFALLSIIAVSAMFLTLPFSKKNFSKRIYKICRYFAKSLYLFLGIRHQEIFEGIKNKEKGIIEKNRYEVQVGKHLFEVDEFIGENEGLLMAEVELESEAEIFEKPKWLGLEVTQDHRYYNSYLSNNPFTKW